jgi:hypothetical protein
MTGKKIRSGHWEYFGKKNDQAPGAGFDVDWKRVNEGTSSLKSLLGEVQLRANAVAAALAGHTTRRHLRVFKELWTGKNPAVTEHDIRAAGGITPIAVLAAHFANVILSDAPASILAQPRLKLCEIGAGSGYLAHFLLRHLPSSEMHIVDLPEVARLGAQNLRRLGWTVSFFEEHDCLSQVTYYTPEQVSDLPADMNVFANTASMQEMMPHMISHYFDMIRTKSVENKSLFYCCNRVEKWLSDHHGSSDDVGSRQDVAVRMAEYPWVPGERDVFYRVSQIHRRIGMEPCQERMILL